MRRSLVGFALNGEWSLGSMLVAETWPARLRGRVISINRAAWCFGASLAGAITGIAAANWGWRTAVMVPGVIALLAIYVRATCPESPYWVRAQDRRQRVRTALRQGQQVSGGADRAWFLKADRVGVRQVFARDMLPSTLVALFVACCSTCIFGTVGARMPLYLATEKGWSTAEYSAFYVSWGIVVFSACGWLAGSPIALAGVPASSLPCSKGPCSSSPGSTATAACCCGSSVSAWSFGFPLWGPSTVLTAEISLTRARGAANGVVWAIAYFVGFVLWPFATVALQQSTGSFKLAFLCIPVFMVLMSIGVWLWVPEHAGKELNEISVSTVSDTSLCA